MILFVFSFACLGVYSQVSLEKQFSDIQIQVINLSATYYYSADGNSGQVTVYKDDYSRYKTFSFDLPTGYKFSSALISDKIFNSDTDFEFLVTAVKINVSGLDTDMTKLVLCNEKGQIMYDFGSATLITSNFIKTISGSSKLILYKMIYNIDMMDYVTSTDIYNVQGDYSGIYSVKSFDNMKVHIDRKNNIIEFESKNLFDKNYLRIYDLKGELFLSKSFEINTNGKYSISSSLLSSGIYVYDFNGVTGKLIIEK